MFKENLVTLRGIHGFSQEEIAEKIGISRQAYAKWETGQTVPDVEKCRLLAEVYGVTIDRLVSSGRNGNGDVAPISAPKGKNIWGTVTMGDRGQIVIPKGAREKFHFTGKTRLVVLSDEVGIALVPAEQFEATIHQMLELAAIKNEE